MPGFSRLDFDSSGLPEDARFATFASGMANFEISTPDKAGFWARATAWRVGDLVLSRIATARTRYARSLGEIATRPADHFYLNLHLQGLVSVDCGSGCETAGDGSLLVLDMRRPSVMDAEVADEISLAIPRRQLVDRLRGADPHGLIASGRMVPLFARVAEGVLDSLPDLDAAHAPHIEAMLTDVAAATLTDALRERDMAGSANPLLAERAIDWIERHLAEPFQVDRLCVALGVSRASLYRALKGSGGAKQLLMRARMRRLRARLEDAAETRSIATLALDCGFADGAHLSRSFKSAYGMTPGAFRQLAAHDGHTTRQDGRRTASHKFADWVASLG